VGFLDFVDSLHIDPKIGKAEKRALLAGHREALRRVTHPHHSSTQGLHSVLDLVDERLRELGYNIPDDCGETWKV